MNNIAEQPESTALDDDELFEIFERTVKAQPNRGDSGSYKRCVIAGVRAALSASAPPTLVTYKVADESKCRIYEYDGAFKCLTHQNTWGAIGKPIANNPSAPCAQSGCLLASIK